MKHYSDINNYNYYITRSICNNPTVPFVTDDDVNLIWVDLPDKDECEKRTFINWYYGTYDKPITEKYIKEFWESRKENANMNMREMIEDQINNVLGDYMKQNGIESGDTTPSQEGEMDVLIEQLGNLMEEIVKQNKPQPKTIDLPICFVDLIEDCLTTIQKHDLLELVYGCYTDPEDEKAKKFDLQTVLDEFCKPLTARDEDVTINVMD